MNLKELGFNFDEIDIPTIFGDIDIDTKYQEYFFNFDDAVLDVPLYFFLKDDLSINQRKKTGFIKLINKAIRKQKIISKNALDNFFASFDQENIYS